MNNLHAQNHNFIEMIKYASKAPSGHNTQPWRFKISGNEVEILPNLADTLAAVDPDRREFYISLGCAVENFCIASEHFGFDPQILRQNADGVLIHLRKTETVTGSDLFDQIEKRQTNRSVYNGKTIPEDTVKILQSIKLQEHTNVYLAKTGDHLADGLTNYVMHGNDIQMVDDAFKTELKEWIRFNKGEVKKFENGLTYSTMGFPAIPRFLGEIILKSVLTPKAQNKSNLKQINSSSHLILFTTENNSVEDWLNLGRSLQRFLLEQTKLNIVNSFLNQPCEVKMLSESMRETLPINREFPQILMRIGYAKEMPYSPRKNLKKIVE
ncbi:MAG: nitroreductase [Tannerella sp.]|jgi:nitroreductase|nr:nitroreductase [Tannerella sp.]